MKVVYVKILAAKNATLLLQHDIPLLQIGHFFVDDVVDAVVVVAVVIQRFHASFLFCFCQITDLA